MIKPDVKPKVDLGKKVVQVKTHYAVKISVEQGPFTMCQILANSDIIYPRGDAIQNEKRIFWSFFRQKF